MREQILEIILHFWVQKLKMSLTTMQNKKMASSQLDLKWWTLKKPIEQPFCDVMDA